jgi:hypothetical protein
MVRKIFKSALILMIVLGLTGTVLALETPTAQIDQPKEETREKTLEGEVAGVSPNFIAIDYGQDSKTSYEMTFNITKNTRLERIPDVKKLKPGDTVWVSYEETVIKKGKETWVKQRIVKVLRLLNAAKIIVEPVVETVKKRTKNEDSLR